MLKAKLKLITRALLGLSFVYFTWLMVLITWQYIPVNYEVAFLALKMEEIHYLHYRVAFFAHVYSSIFILILGFVQFNNFIHRQYPKLHRNVGKIYISLILLIAAPSGFIMGIHGNGGFYSKLSFCLQALLWFYFTYYAFKYAKKQLFTKHRDYMILSYAMTLSAVSLRLFKWIIVNTVEWAPMDTYKIVVWLGWLFNIVIAFLIIRYSHKKTG